MQKVNFTLAYQNERNSAASWHLEPKSLSFTVFLKVIGEIFNDWIGEDEIIDNYSIMVSELISFYEFVEYLCFNTFKTAMEEKEEGELSENTLKQFQKGYACQKWGNPQFCFFMELGFFIFNHFINTFEFDERLVKIYELLGKFNDIA